MVLPERLREEVFIGPVIRASVMRQERSPSGLVSLFGE
jgi:hypothetical protein